jgi:MoxR-like ATPase
VKTVHAAGPLLDYIQELVEHSRRAPEYTSGLSPRAALALLHAARAWALIEGRDKVVPEDVQVVLPGVAGHRLRPVHDGVRISSLDKASGLISAVPVP